MKGYSYSIKYILPILSIFFSFLLMTGCEQKQTAAPSEPRLIKAIQVTSQPRLFGRTFPGLAKATQEVDLAFDVSGTLIEKPIHNGEKVIPGQLIARLNPHDFEVNLNSARAKLVNISRNYDRGKELMKKNFISQMEIDKLQTEYDIAKSDYALAEKALNDSVLKAPFAGEIATSYVENFQAVQAKQPVARLLDISSIEMDIHIPETLISNAKQVNQLEVTFDAFPKRPIMAVIKEMSSEASSNTRTYKVTLSIKQPEEMTILPGMAGNAIVTGLKTDEKAMGQIFIPPQAIFTTEDNKHYVWIIDPTTQKVSQREITLGAVNEIGIMINSGVKTGEWIAISGIYSLRSGEKVKIFKGNH